MRILLIDDHPIINEGLTALLEHVPDIDVVGVARDSAEGFAKLCALRPDCVVVDLSLPDVSGIEAIRLFLVKMPDLGVVVFTGHKSEDYLYQALEAGARGYVLKGSALSDLVSALREVHMGGYWLSPDLNPAVIKRYLGKAGTTRKGHAEFDTLSAREREIFHLLARGKSPKDIGTELFISVKTVSKHKIAIQKKLKLKNAVEMARFAMKSGLMPPSTF